MNDIDLTYIIRVCSAYDSFFKSYQGPYITIDTSHLDYYAQPQDIEVPLKAIQTVLNMFSYLKPHAIERTGNQPGEEQRE